MVELERFAAGDVPHPWRPGLQVEQVGELGPQTAAQTVASAAWVNSTPPAAATPEDLLDGVNDVRPHVVHVSGHAGDAAVLFDNASIDRLEGLALVFHEVGLLGSTLAWSSAPVGGGAWS